MDLNINFKIINIVGTNGKGSIAEYLSEGLIKNDFNVGTFTSPHLIVPNERIKYNNKNISDLDFFNIKKTIPKLNFFETIYIVAIIYFVNKKVDVAIIEAGIGGNKDTTKALQGEIGIVTSIGIDHQMILGNSLEQIATDKAGIINSKMKFYIPSSIPLHIQQIFKNKANDFFIVKNKANNFLLENKILASKILEKEFNINQSSFKDIKGRVSIEIINNIKYVFDVAHNNSGIKAILKYLENKKITFKNVVICIQKKKQINNLKILFKNKKIYFLKLNDAFRNFKNIKQISFQDISKLNGNVLLIGSFYFIGYLYEKIEIKNNKKFFKK